MAVTIDGAAPTLLQQQEFRAAFDLPTTGDVAAKYTKPGPGIPAADLDAATQAAIVEAQTTASAVFAVQPQQTAQATAAALQSAVNRKGTVVFSAGDFFIDRTIILPSDTRVIVPQGARIIPAKGGPRVNNTFPIFQNASADSVPVNVSGISAVAYSNYMALCTVQFEAAHGITSGYVQIKGDGHDVYNGIWPVFSVPSAASLTFLMSIAGGSTGMPPNASVSVASAAQTVANPGVFSTAANTFTAGQAVTLTGAAPGGFALGTVYYVIKTGLGANTVQLADSPFAASGKQVTASAACTIKPVIQGSAADGNISIEGRGLIDGQYAAQAFTESGDYHDHAVILRRVRRPLVDGLNFRDIRKYCIMMQDVWEPVARNYSGDTGSDGCHIYGPAWNPLIENVSGTFGDDPAVFQPVDGVLYTAYMLGSGFDCGGDFFNGTMRNVRARHTHNTGAAVIYPQGNTGGAGATSAIYRMRGKFKIEDASTEDPGTINGNNWRGWYAVGVGNGYVPVAASMDCLEISGVYGSVRVNNNGGAVMPITQMVVKAGTGDQFFGDSATIDLDWVSINSLCVDSVNHMPGQGGGLVTVQSSNVTIGMLTMKEGYAGNPAAAGSCYMLQVIGAPSIGVINFFNVNLGPNGQLMGPATFASTPTINVIGGGGNAYKCGFEKSDNAQSLNINISDFTSTNPTIGMFNFYGSDSGKTANVKIRVKGLVYAGTLFANQTGANYSVFNPDGSMPVDLTKLSRTSAQTAAHNGATSAGTIVANNLCVCDATGAANSWKQMTDTTKTY